MQAQTPGSLDPQSPTAAATYIATMTEELALMAQRNSLDALAYILQMAHMEADQIAKGASDPSGAVP